MGKMYERNIAWQSTKEKKIIKERKKETKDEVRECTFRPNLKSSINSL